MPSPVGSWPDTQAYGYRDGVHLVCLYLPVAALPVAMTLWSLVFASVQFLLSCFLLCTGVRLVQNVHVLLTRCLLCDSFPG